jgi:hypothetical protein
LKNEPNPQHQHQLPLCLLVSALVCRDWAIIFGGIMTMLSFVPTFRNMRLFAIYALIGAHRHGVSAQNAVLCF